MRRAQGYWLVLGLTLSGCSQPPPPADTGARAVAQQFADAVRDSDWSAAYALLHPASRAGMTKEQFQRRAEQYRRGLGFEPDAVHLTACSERGADALAHVVFTGASRRYKDVVVLQPSDTGWGVVVPSHFGRPRPSAKP